MELSYCPSSSLTIAIPNHKFSRPKSSNLMAMCPQISPSLGFRSFNGRCGSKNISSKLNCIRTSTQPGFDKMAKKRVSNFGDACWRLLRLYTLKGVVVASSCLFARALIENPNLIEWSLLPKALNGLFALVCANIYTTAINQIYDVEVDRINKPYLPLASGEISLQSAWLVAVFFAVAGLSVVGLTCRPLLTCLYAMALFLTTAYSAPPFRLKKSPIATMFSIAIGMGFLLNFGVYSSTITTLGLSFQWRAPLVFITTFATINSVVMVITKDLSDVEGDNKCGIPTLATKLGVRNVAYLGCGLLLFYYVAAAAMAINNMPQALRCNLIITVHFIASLTLIYEQVLEYMKSSESVIKKILEALMKRLNVDEIDESTRSVLMGSKRINLNYYPICPNPELTVGVGRHSDVSTLTFLLQDDIGGLYVHGRDGHSWIHVPPVIDSIVINVGDALEIMSNGRYKSVEHRVAANGTKNRISVPIFVNPKPSDIIGPMSQVTSYGGKEPIYRQVRYSDYVKHFFKKAHDGKNTIDYVKI